MKTKLFSTGSIILIALVFLSQCKQQPEPAAGDDLIYGDGDYIYGPEIDNWGEEIKQQQRENARAFLEKLSETIQAGGGEINLEEKHFRFSTDHLDNIGNAFITIRDVSDITINGNGAEFWFEDYISGIRIQNAKNITFNDLTMDWDPLTFSQVEVTSIDPEGRYFEAKTEPGFRSMMEILSDPFFRRRPGVKIFIFHPETGVLKKNYAHSELDSMVTIDDQHIRYYGRVYGVLDYHMINLEPGDRVALVFRDAHGINIDASEDITFDNLNLYSSPFYGISMVNGGGGLVLTNSKLIPRPGTRRLMSMSGDATHFISVQRGPRFENNEFSGAGDDIMNLQADLSMVQDQHGPTEVVIAIKNFMNIFEGSTIRIYDFNNMQLKGEFKVLDTTEGGDELRRDARAVGEEQGLYFWPGRASLICELDKPVEVNRYDIVESDFGSGYGAVIRNNYLHNVTTRGFLIQTKNAIVENNEFVNIDNAAIAIMASTKWCEGPIPENIVIRNNRIVKPGWAYGSRHIGNSKIGAISVNLEYFDSLKQNTRPMNGIIIENNEIYNAGTCGIFMIHTRNGTIRDNLISGYCEVDPWRVGTEYGIKPYGAMYIDDSEQVEIIDNRIENPGEYAVDDIIIGKYADKESIIIKEPVE